MGICQHSIGSAKHRLELERQKLRARQGLQSVLEKLSHIAMHGHPDTDYIKSLQAMHDKYQELIEQINKITGHENNG